ncbi:GNAT family N-acetyltransferase [Brenneria sp. 4F2]|nr:GNAT family N-acetyltransferase [Brenneria bubanii]
MIIASKAFQINGLEYVIRPAVEADAQVLSELRARIDGETENLDREGGESFIDVSGFERLIRSDSLSLVNLFPVAVVDRRIVGFSRAEGSPLRSLAHKIEFGVCVLKDFWRQGIGKNLLAVTIAGADAGGIKKIARRVLSTNTKAIALYKTFGFEVEDILKNDKLLADGHYYHPLVMGRWRHDRGQQARV